jgi:hypothetical protein
MYGYINSSTCYKGVGQISREKNTDKEKRLYLLQERNNDSFVNASAK